MPEATMRQKSTDIRTLARIGAINWIRTMKREFPGILRDVKREEQLAAIAHARAAKQRQ